MGNGLQNVFRRGKKQEPPATDLNTTAVGQHHQQQPAQYGMTYSLEPPHLSAYAFHASPCYMDTYNTPVNHQVAGPYDEALAYTSPSAPSVQASTGPPPTSPEKRTLPQPQGVANQAAVETFDKASSASRGPRTPRASSLPRPSKSTPGAENPTAASPSSAAGRKPLAHKGVPSPLPRKPISPRKEQPTSEAPPTPDIPPTPPRKSDQFDTVVAQELNAGQDAKYQLEITPPVGQLTIPSSSRVDPPLTPTLVPPKPLDSAVESHPLGPVSSPGAASGSSLLPPVARHPLDTPNPQGLDQEPTRDVKGWLLDQQVSTEQLHQVTPPTERPSHYVIDRPTCSINLVCYRSGAKGCSRKQIQCVLRSRFPDEESYEKMVSANGHLMQTDVEFFEEARRLFEHEMCDFFRRWFSLKSLRAFRVLAYTPTTRPVVVPLDDFVLQEMMYAYHNPDRLSSQDDWIQWVFRLRRRDRRHAIEFVEGWNSTRIGIAGTIPWLSSCIVGIAWTAAGGDVQSAFTVASFILTSSSIILAILAIISSIESSGKSGF